MAKRHIILYDDTCSFCRAQRRKLERWDWSGRFEWRPLSDPGATGLAPGLTPEALNAALHCVSREGSVYRGAQAFRFIALRLPVLSWLGLLLWLPGAGICARMIYRMISAHRHRL